MARGLYMGFEDIESKLSKLEDGPKLRELTRRVVYAGAKVLEKEIKASMEQAGHVRHHGGDWMQGSVSMGEILQEPGRTSVLVGPTGEDPRGVSNEMKDKIIQTGYWNRETGRGRTKRDPYMDKAGTRKRIEPRLQAVMQYEMTKSLEEIFGK